jgi:hypothetical protein
MTGYSIQDVTFPQMSAEELSAKLETLDGHISILDKHAKEYFRRHPKIKSVSVNLGAMFILQVGLTLTWVNEG